MIQSTVYNKSNVTRKGYFMPKKLKDRLRNDTERYGHEIIESDEMKQAFYQKHHRRITVGEHTFRVLISSLIICYILEWFNIKTNIPAIVVAALCHDLGILGRYDKFSSPIECSKEHPKDSVKVAKKLVPNISYKTENIIESHMWPIATANKPSSIEGVIISITDKYTAVKDLIRGSNNNSVRAKQYVLAS